MGGGVGKIFHSAPPQELKWNSLKIFLAYPYTEYKIRPLTQLTVTVVLIQLTVSVMKCITVVWFKMTAFLYTNAIMMYTSHWPDVTVCLWY